MVLARNAAAGREFYIPLLPRRRKLHIPRFAASGKAHSFRCSSFPHKISDFAGDPFSQSDFASQKSCICAVAHITKSACPTAAKKRLLPHSAAPQSTPPPLFRVSRKQRYNTLDFAKQNRVPTGQLAPLLEPPRQRGAGLRWRPQSVKRFEALTEPTGETSLCNPSFPSQVHIQTAKCSLQCLLGKCKRKPARVRGADFLLGGNAEGMGGSYFCIPTIRTAGTSGNEL